MDKYNERLVKGKTPFSSYAMVVGAVLLATAGVLLTFMFSWGIVVLAVGGFLTYWSFSTLNIEYEYILVNGDIDISKIISQKTRKEVKSIKLGDITLFTNTENHKIQHDIESNSEVDVKDYTDKSKKSYYVIVSNEGGKEVINIFDFDEKCVDHMKFFLKQKTDL